jgi:hypothetical protein
MRSLVSLCGILLLVPIFVVHGQISNSVMGASASITLDPAFPNPGEPVTATLDDYSINSSGASIHWLLDGHEIPGAVNKRSIILTADKNGGTAQVAVQLTFTNRPAVNATATIHPIFLDVIVEPQTYVPIFYAGRALPVYGSTVNVTALMQLHNGMIDPANYTYTWELNSKVLYGGPQRGNNRAQITIPYGLSSTLILSVADQNGTIVGRRLINIPSVPVELQFYEQSALYGLNSKAIGTTMRVINSSTIRAVPYYLDIKAITGNTLESEWRINGQKNTVAESNPFEINLKSQGSGNARVSFKFRNLAQLIQGGEKSFTATF